MNFSIENSNITKSLVCFEFDVLFVLLVFTLPRSHLHKHGTTAVCAFKMRKGILENTNMGVALRWEFFLDEDRHGYKEMALFILPRFENNLDIAEHETVSVFTIKLLQLISTMVQCFLFY